GGVRGGGGGGGGEGGGCGRRWVGGGAGGAPASGLGQPQKRASGVPRARRRLLLHGARGPPWHMPGRRSVCPVAVPVFIGGSVNFFVPCSYPLFGVDFITR